MKGSLVEVTGLSKVFRFRRGLLQTEVAELRAVDGVDLSILEGETLALVGESGSSKTILARCILRLLDASEGDVFFAGEDLLAMSAARLRRARRSFQMVFQDPSGSLDPRMRVGKTLEEPLIVHDVVAPEARAERVGELLELVGLPKEAATRFPHEFSGGQRQRIAIARALAPEPIFLVADEPVAALDVSVRAQILNILSRLQERLKLTLLLIAHDLAVVGQMADRVAILYFGRVVELAPTAALLAAPQHPYTVSLLAAVPVLQPPIERRSVLMSGDRANPLSPPAGCAFHPRCPAATELCKTDRPRLLEVESEHEVACHHPGELELDRIDSS